MGARRVPVRGAYSASEREPQSAARPVHCHPGAAWVEAGRSEGTGRRDGDRSCGEAVGELAPDRICEYRLLRASLFSLTSPGVKQKPKCLLSFEKSAPRLAGFPRAWEYGGNAISRRFRYRKTIQNARGALGVDMPRLLGVVSPRLSCLGVECGEERSSGNAGSTGAQDAFPSKAAPRLRHRPSDPASL